MKLRRAKLADMPFRNEALLKGKNCLKNFSNVEVTIQDWGGLAGRKTGTNIDLNRNSCCFRIAELSTLSGCVPVVHKRPLYVAGSSHTISSNQEP